MKRISTHTPYALHTAAQTRALEQKMTKAMPTNTLVKRAGAAVARLSRALTPHASCIWIACGPGDNGGDGLAAAVQLQPWALANSIQLLVTWCGTEEYLSAHTLDTLRQSRACGVQFVDTAPEHCDLVIDAVLGLGVHDQFSGEYNTERHARALIQQVNSCTGLRLCVDMPSGLHPDSGQMTLAHEISTSHARATFTLTFFTLKPGLFTAHGRDASGEIWLDELGAENHFQPETGQLWLGAFQTVGNKTTSTRHSSHKGTHGDVWVVGGQHISHNGKGMTGAVVLAARAALHTGAGRVFVVPLGAKVVDWDAQQPELMFRSPDILTSHLPLASGCWVCGCGGGELIKAHVRRLACQANTLVVDADALNAIADDSEMASAIKERIERGQLTVLTPHPLEAARLLGKTTADIQADRLGSARALAHRFGAICVLKGSGTVTATPSGQAVINFSGDGRLATAGTGDVLAGMLGAALTQLFTSDPTLSATSIAMDTTVLDVITHAVWLHGHAADSWDDQAPRLTASSLTRAL